MPTFDVVSELDMQEVRNAVDQASREVSTRYDFKNTGSSIELKDKEIELNTESEARLTALTQVLEEKMVKRHVSLKALGYGKIEEASKGAVRQVVIRPAMDDAVERPDLGMKEGAERRDLDAFLEPLGKPLLGFRNRAGLQPVGAHLDDHGVPPWKNEGGRNK